MRPWRPSRKFAFDFRRALKIVTPGGLGSRRNLKLMPAPPTSIQSSREYPTGELVRRLLALAWRYRADFLLSVVLSLVLLLLALMGLQLLGLVIDVIRQALDPSLPAPRYPFDWKPPPTWTALQIVTALSLAIVARAVLRAFLTYWYNMTTARLTQGE